MRCGCIQYFVQSLEAKAHFAVQCLTVLTERFQLLLNEIKQIENKNSLIINLIHKDAFLSKAASNEETASQDRHPCETDSENTSLLVNNSNISLLFPPDTFMVITFAGALKIGPKPNPLRFKKSQGPLGTGWNAGL